MLGSPYPPPRRRGRAGLTAGLVGLGVMAVAVTAVAAATFLGGGGAQPEDVLPGNALAMVKLDLDPSAEQKLAVYRLAKRFPSVADRVRDEDRVKDQLLSALFEGVPDLDYDRDVAPWVGDRVGAALVPGDEPQPLAAVAFDDRSAAEAGMDTLRSAQQDLFYAFSDRADYVLIGTSQETVDSAARGEQVLADSDTWQKGQDALDEDQIVTAWADLAALWAAMPAKSREEAAQAYGVESDFALDGVVAAGLRAADDHLELVGKALDVESPLQLEPPIGGGSGRGLVQRLPQDTVAALSVTNLGAGLVAMFDTAYGKDDPMGIVASAQDLGFSLPEDLGALLGDETVAALLGEDEGAVASRTDDPDAAYDVASRLAGLLDPAGDPSDVLRRLDEGIALGTSPEAVEAISGADGGLGDTDAFRAAVPGAEGAGTVAYVDIARVLELYGEELGERRDDAAALRAFGMTSSGDARNSTFRLRLTVKD